MNRAKNTNNLLFMPPPCQTDNTVIDPNNTLIIELDDLEELFKLEEDISQD